MHPRTVGGERLSGIVQLACARVILGRGGLRLGLIHLLDQLEAIDRPCARAICYCFSSRRQRECRGRRGLGQGHRRRVHFGPLLRRSAHGRAAARRATLCTFDVRSQAGRGERPTRGSSAQEFKQLGAPALEPLARGGACEPPEVCLELLAAFRLRRGLGGGGEETREGKLGDGESRGKKLPELWLHLRVQVLKSREAMLCLVLGARAVGRLRYVVISSRQYSSEVISNHQWSSVVITHLHYGGHQVKRDLGLVDKSGDRNRQPSGRELPLNLNAAPRGRLRLEQCRALELRSRRPLTFAPAQRSPTSV